METGSELQYFSILFVLQNILKDLKAIIIIYVKLETNWKLCKSYKIFDGSIYFVKIGKVFKRSIIQFINKLGTAF